MDSEAASLQLLLRIVFTIIILITVIERVPEFAVAVTPNVTHDWRVSNFEVFGPSTGFLVYRRKGPLTEVSATLRTRMRLHSHTAAGVFAHVCDPIRPDRPILFIGL